MYISEVRSKGAEIRRERGSFIHRRYFETLEEGLEWARELAGHIVDAGRFSDEEIVMEHSEVR